MLSLTMVVGSAYLSLSQQMKKETCYVATVVLARLSLCICLVFHLKQILSGRNSSFGRIGSCQSEIQEHLESHYG